MHKDLLSSIICEFLKKEEILDVGKQTINKIIIKSSTTKCFVVYSDCIIKKEMKYKTRIYKVQNPVAFMNRLLRLLFDYEFIGNQAHIQDLTIIIGAEDLSTIEIKQIGMVIHPTIFETSEV